MGNSARSCLPLSCLVRDDADDDKEEKQYQLPWLLVCRRDNYMEKRLYNVTTNEVSSFVFRIHPFEENIGSFNSCSRGWLFFMDYKSYTLLAFNPLSASIFHLPPFDIRRFVDLRMVILSADPLLVSNFEVLAVSYGDTLAHFKSGHGDEFWTYSDDSIMRNGYRISNFIFYKDRLLGAYENDAAETITLLHVDVVRGGTAGGGRDGSIKIIKEIAWMPNLKGFESEEVDLDFESVEADVDFERKEVDMYVVVYLVETTKGDLLVVHRYSENSEEDDEIFRAYKVYKLICHSHGHDDDFQFQLIPIEDLGGDSLFLSPFCQHSLSVLAADYPGCMPNSIYYASTESEMEIEVFNVEDERVSKCFVPTEYPTRFPTTWMVPSMKL
ncbi:hypothetical protein FNV43_RR22367 [Rhamnella rubrinervis]|uniref:KIB1-4 beta-propeller domain-containing protein n=1 Tax=Rhamnella rubrinervis TaxID=2594499 RepID=A0A8K0GV51_9ROSA|nr:hypothetical protein FNV43_RR22367 [Rhamnella rubrinervis]